MKIGPALTVILSVSICVAFLTSSAAATGWQSYMVTIIRLPRHSWSGFGVYLGDGKILTAQHVVGNFIQSKPYVEIGGRTLATTLIREGNFAEVDLAELGVDIDALPAEVRSLPPPPICPADAAVGTRVEVVTPTQIAPSHIVSPATLPPWLFSPAVIAQFPTLIGDVYSTGNSGSGVFNTSAACLLGIISRKIELTETTMVDGAPVKHVQPLAKYFVGPLVIRQFLGQ